MPNVVIVPPDQIGGHDASPPPQASGVRVLFRTAMRTWPSRLTLVLVVGVISYLALVPLGFLLWSTFVVDGSLSLDNFREAYSSESFSLGRMVGNSLRFALGATALSIFIGTTLAYLAVRTDVPFRRLIFAAALVPIVIPGVLYTIGWVFLASPQIGWVNELTDLSVGLRPFNIFSMTGMIFVEGMNQSPLVFLLMYGAFKSMDPALEESALMSGASLPTVLSRITLPLVRPAVFSAILIMTVLALEAFEGPTLLGVPAGIWLFTSRIYRVLSEFPVNYGAAGAYATSLMLLTTTGIYIQSRFTKNAKAYQTVTGKGFRPRPNSLGRWRWPTAGFVMAYFMVAVVLPLGVLLYTSFQPYYSVPSVASLRSSTLENYRQVLSDPAVANVLQNSTILALTSATAVVLVTAIAAWIVIRTRIRGRWVLDNLAFLPLTIPGLVLGVSLLIVYLRVPIAVYGTLWILFIAYCTRYLPYGMRYSSASMYQIGAELEESAQTSGATWGQTFRRVVLPLLLPGLTAGWIYIVMSAMRELSSSILLYSPGNEVLAIYIWEAWESGQVTRLSAAGVLLMILLFGIVLLGQRLGAKFGVQE
jgi:iron(III) transport system permease protein